ncbi:MAG TPA: site-specific integrase [Candidatus Faecousia intestinigallinarum]|nr:site-specific integrase [Candidatus Faecousia intestinigallinarum]
MAKKKGTIPTYGTAVRRGIQYYRTRITDADGKRVDLYAESCEELYQKEQEARRQVEDAIFRRENPTVAEYCEKWLLMQSAKVSPGTIRGYSTSIRNYIIKPLGEMYLSDVTADDIRLAMIPLATKSAGVYSTVNMLLKCVFYSAERNQLLDYNPCVGISAKGGKASKKREALTDKQVDVLLDTVKGLPPYTFIMLALYSGLRREEILGLQWDCVFLDVPTPYLSVRRAWRTEHNKPVITTTLKTKAARRDIPIPKCLADRLREVKKKSISEYVIADGVGEPLSASQFQRMWKYVTVRSTKPHTYYKYVNGQCIKRTVTPTPGGHQKNHPDLVYAIDFDVTPHQLRHTYITNLLYAGVDPKTVQYLAGHENSKTTMDIYAQVKYNKPEELVGVVNTAFHQRMGVSEPPF